MTRRYDEKQQLVLDCSKQNQIVSAGAGSGKTTVMIKKISDIVLTGKANLNQVIVLTFTNLAASEMKQRLTKSFIEALNSATDIEEKQRISALLSDVDTAHVDTIDGFCSKMCKKYFYKLNISPDINIVTGLSLDYYRNKSLDKSIETALSSNKQQIIDLIDCFEKSSRSLDCLKTNLLNAFYFVMAQEDPEKFLNLSSNEYTGFNLSSEFLNNYLVNTINKNILKIELEINSLAQYEAYFSSVKSYISVLRELSLSKSLIDNVNIKNKLPKISNNKIKEEDKPTYNLVKACLKNISTVLEDFEFCSKFDQTFLLNNSTHFTTFISLLRDFINAYQEIKTQNKVVDFSDLERNMLTLLSFDDIKKEIYNDFKYIFVDEYQDINPMQNKIITELKSDSSNIFFVGDVKQSIYGFRQSTPEMFLKTYQQYKSDSNSESFDMNINFRSNPQLLEFNNEIFNKLMTEEKADINYKTDSQFEPKRTDFETQEDNIEIAIFDTVDENEEYAQNIYSVKNAKSKNTVSATQKESEFIADRIINLVNNEFYDSSLKIKRKMEFSDITILSRSVNDADTNILVKTLRAHNIPINIINKVELSKSESINLILNILKVIANVGDDVAFATYLTSNLVNLSLDEMFEISCSCNEKTFLKKLLFYKENYNNALTLKVNYAFNLLEEIKVNSSNMTNLELIDMLLNKYHVKQYILNSLNGKNELLSLTNFLATISAKENQLQLVNFIGYVQTNISNKTEYSQTDAINSVTIQTIHASKGLEYPVVILFNSNKKFKPNNDRDDINFDTDLGIGMHYFNLENRTKLNSLPRFAIGLKNKIKCYKEELRLLYVATTRPQNKLIITGSVKFDDIRNSKLSMNNYISLIFSVFANRLNIDSETNKLKNCMFYCFSDYQSKSANIKNTTSTSFNINNKNLEFVYPNTESCNISLKNNVTGISRELNEDYNILPIKLKPTENLNANVSSYAQIGTTYHNYLSNIDFTSSYKPIKCVDVDESLLKLAHEKIYPIAKGCTNIKQEAQFMMYVPYNEIYKESKIFKKVLVQGVVDLMIEFESHFVLIDFKYSRLSINALKEKYKTQLELYKMAIEKAYKKPVLKSYIYKINSGEII